MPGREEIHAESLADPGAFRAFYRETLPVVYGYLLKRCGGRSSTAEDLTQETFMAAVRSIRQGAVPESATGWVLGIARHKLIDHLRREERSERNLSLAWDAGRVSEEELWEGGSPERAMSALQAVAPAQRAALTLRYLDGMSVDEVARVLGRTVHATESLLARGRDRFKRAYLEVTD